MNKAKKPKIKEECISILLDSKPFGRCTITYGVSTCRGVFLELKIDSVADSLKSSTGSPYAICFDLMEAFIRDHIGFNDVQYSYLSSILDKWNQFFNACGKYPVVTADMISAVMGLFDYSDTSERQHLCRGVIELNLTKFNQKILLD